jgi:hypothetical protein
MINALRVGSPNSFNPRMMKAMIINEKLRDSNKTRGKIVKKK